MLLILGVVYGIVLGCIIIWAITMFRSNRHFRTKMQHPSLAHHIH
jgi:hypothetical protein